ncbi:MAG: S8 family serine peptidase, partial [Saprospiraceae bacterium]
MLGCFLLGHCWLYAQLWPGKSPAGKQPAVENPGQEIFRVVVTDGPAFKTWLEAEGLELAGEYLPANILVVRTSRAVLAAKILPRPEVLFVDAPGAPKTELPVPGQNLFVNAVNAAQAIFPDLNGAGTTISIQENRFDTADVDFKNRWALAPDVSSQIALHASIVASLTAGAGNSDLAGRGVAWGARLVSSGFNNLLPESDADYAAQAVTVQNHSYGLAIENYYGASALAFDQSVALRPRLLHVFSAGNSGELASEAGTYADIPGFANLTGNFKMAKNVLTVGAVDSFGQVAAFSSRGPAYDGRLKPDLVAYGNDGTSGAAALVSGAAAVVQQALRVQTGAWPSAALVRAVLLNSAEDAARPGPDFLSGFGNLNLKNALETVAGQQFAGGELGQGETRNFPLTIPPNTRSFRAMLSWDDPPAAPNAARALLHDLDVKILAPDGSVWLPWVLNPAPVPDSLDLPALRRRDTLNNVEQVSLEYPAPGVYTIQVTASNISTASQAFSLTWRFEADHQFQWSFPVKNDPVVGGSEVVLRWSSTLADTTGSVDYRIIGTTTWLPVTAGLALHAGYRRWLAPDTFAEAQLRIQAGGLDFISDTFLIAPALRMDLGFNCPDSVLLFWNAAAPEATYLIYGLGDRYLEPLFAMQDTFIVLPKAVFPQQRFAVAPLGQHGIVGLRSAAPDIRTQGVGCYFKSFLAELNAASQVDLTLRIGTTYGVKRVLFEKAQGGIFHTLHEQTADKNLFTFTDDNPQPGGNIYRAQLLLDNGTSLFSEQATVYFAGETGAWVFPNPLTGQNSLQVVSAFSEEADFLLFDVLGRL